MGYDQKRKGVISMNTLSKIIVASIFAIIINIAELTVMTSDSFSNPNVAFFASVIITTALVWCIMEIGKYEGK